jgi:hypothetical protein
VSDFINGTTVTGNEEKLRQFLLPMDVEVAMRIPLSGHRHDDFWSWHYDRRGAFTVRTAYKMLVATKEKREAWLENRASSSNGEIVEKQWTELWRTKVPSKVRLFLWRLAKQSLPTNDVCHHRNMADNDPCQLCGGQDSWRHALIDCAMSRCIWALEDEEIIEHLQCSEEGDARAWLATMIATLKHEERVGVFVTLWSIWHARRKAIHEQIYQSPLSVHAFVN